MKNNQVALDMIVACLADLGNRLPRSFENADEETVEAWAIGMFTAFATLERYERRDALRALRELANFVKMTQMEDES